MKMSNVGALAATFALVVTTQGSFASSKSESANIVSATGGDSGNGGDPLGLEFVQSAHLAIENVKADIKDFPELRSLRLGNLLTRTKVVVVDISLSALVGHAVQESAALNIPSSGIIFLNRLRWTGIQNNDVRQALALHELLGLLGIEKTGVYIYSQRYLELRHVNCAVGLCATSPSYHCALLLDVNHQASVVTSGDILANPLGASLQLTDGKQIKVAINVIPNGDDGNFGIQLYKRTGPKPTEETIESSVDEPIAEFPAILNFSWVEELNRRWRVSCVQK